MNERADRELERKDIAELAEAKEGDPSTNNNARQMNARAVIARKNEHMVASDPAMGFDAPISDGVPDDDIEGGYSPAFLATDTTLQTILDQMPKQADAPAKTYNIKVNGKEMSLTEEELIARAQKVEAADQYLAQAKKLAESPAPQPAIVQQPQVVSEPQPPSFSDEDLELARVLQVGGEEDAARAIARIRALQKSPSIPVDEIADRTIATLGFREDVRWFRDEYKDIFEDEKLRTLAVHMDDEYLRKGDPRSYRERYQDIGEQLRKWNGRNPEFTEKQQKKAASVQSIPQASVKAARAVEEDDGEDNAASVIVQMAKARGQIRI